MQTITREQLKSMNEESSEDFVLVNVLPRDTFNQKHIRTSVNIPYDSPDFVQTVEKIAGSRDRTIVVYCASFECDASIKAAKKLEDAGFTKVLDYKGGTKDWFEGKERQAA